MKSPDFFLVSVPLRLPRFVLRLPSYALFDGTFCGRICSLRICSVLNTVHITLFLPHNVFIQSFSHAMGCTVDDFSQGPFLI